MQIEVREIKESDFRVLSEIHNSHNEPDFHTTPAKMQNSHQNWLKQDDNYRRIVATIDDEPVAYAMRCSRDDDMPKHYWIDLSVAEEHRLIGVEKKMIDELLQDDIGREAECLWNCIRSDFNRTVEFLNIYGFEEEFRSWGSHLDLTKFDLEGFKSEILRLESEGIRFISYADLNDVDKETKLLKLHHIIEDDTPYYEPVIPKERDDIRSEDVPDEGCFVALDDNRIIGMAGLENTKNNGLQNSLTGVDNAYRNRGIATALKALVADYAKSQGEVDINAAGSGKNSPMLKVNVKLGFDIEPAWITSCANLKKLI